MTEFNRNYDFTKYDSKEDNFYKGTNLKVVKLFLALREKDDAKKIKTIAEIFDVLGEEIEDEKRKELQQYLTLN